MDERIFVVCPDSNATIGGVKQLYRHVDALCAHGVSARALHYKKNFRLNWFENNTPVISWSEITWRETDILVIPEIYGPHLSKQLRLEIDKTLLNRSSTWDVTLPAIRKVIFNQNAYNTFSIYGFDLSDRSTPYHDPLVVATIVVSEDSKEYLASIFPTITIHRIRNGIHSSVFSFEHLKKKQICFMPRKHRQEAQEVINIAKFHGALDGYSIKVIDQLNEADTAAIMKESLIFLSFGYPEGFSLPPAEAMAAGCIVIGYHGGGGKEFMLPSYSFPIEATDIRSFAATLESVLTAYAKDPSALDLMRRSASKFIHQQYSIENETADICAAWSAILGRTIN